MLREPLTGQGMRMDQLVAAGRLALRQTSNSPATWGVYEADREICAVERHYGSWRQLWQPYYVVAIGGRRFRTCKVRRWPFVVQVQAADEQPIATATDMQVLEYGGRRYQLKRDLGPTSFSRVRDETGADLLKFSYGGADLVYVESIEVAQPVEAGLLAVATALAFAHV